jgi:hypothetical protein
VKACKERIFLGIKPHTAQTEVVLMWIGNLYITMASLCLEETHNLITIVTCVNDCRWGFGLEIGFIDHFHSRLVTTLNYNAITEFRTLQITAAHTKSFQSAVSSRVVPW